MKRGKRIDAWYPFYIDKWLWGSTRHELVVGHGWAERFPDLANIVPESVLKSGCVDLRGIFLDLMTLSKKDGGFIRANETTPYPIEQLAGMFCVPVDYVLATISICLHRKVGKLDEVSPGIYYITSTETYAITDKWKREKTNKINPIDECSQKPEHTSVNTEARGEEIRGKERRGEDSVAHTDEIALIVSRWNKFAESRGLAKIKGVEKKSVRESRLKKRLESPDFDFGCLLDIIGRSPFLLGQVKPRDDSQQPFRVTFDWIICPTNYQKIIEGNYLEKKTPTRKLTPEEIESIKTNYKNGEIPDDILADVERQYGISLR